MFFACLALTIFLRVRIFTEQFGGGRHGGRNRFSRRRSFGRRSRSLFLLGRLGFRSRSGGGISLHFFFLFRRGRFFLFFGHNEIQ